MLAVLARLHYLTGRADYRQRAEDLMTAFSGEITRNFFPLATLLNAAELLISAQQVVVVGERGTAATEALLRVVAARCLPTRNLQAVATAEPLPARHPGARDRKGDAWGQSGEVQVDQG